jgi:hypothetical protein
MATRKKLKEKTYVERWRVDIIETERGWGSKVDESKYFKSLKRANTFVAKYNAKNNEPVVPVWYMYATSPMKVMVEDTE